MSSYLAAQALQKAERDWRAGKMVPCRITVALNANSLYGPEVDVACGAEEPAVDQWEAGILYPTWQQVLLLAELCGVTPGFFMQDFAGDKEPMRGIICSRGRGGRGCVPFDTSGQVTVFAREAIAVTVRGASHVAHPR